MAKVKLGDVAREFKENCKGGKDGLPIVGLEHLIPEEITLTMWDEEKENTFTKMFRKGQVLFGRRRAYLKKAAVAPFDGICSGDITVVEAIQDKIVPELLPFIIQDDSLFNYAVEKSAGSLSPRVKWEHLKNYEFNLPDINDQKKLAKLLWAANDTKEAYKKLLSLTDDLVKSQFIQIFGDLERNPNNYPIKTLNDVCELITDGTHQTPVYSDNGYFFLSSKDVTTGKINWEDIKYIPEELHAVLYKRLAPKLNDILLAKNGTTGVAAIVDRDCVFDIYVSLALLRPIRIMNPIYLHCVINSDDCRKQFNARLKGIGVPNLHLNEIRNTKILVPPIELQNEFADIIKQFNKSKYELQQTISNLENTVKSLMKQYIG